MDTRRSYKKILKLVLKLRLYLKAIWSNKQGIASVEILRSCWFLVVKHCIDFEMLLILLSLRRILSHCSVAFFFFEMINQLLLEVWRRSI